MEPLLAFAENKFSSVALVHSKAIVDGTVVGDWISLCHTGEGQYVSGTLLVKPDSSVAGKLADPFCFTTASVGLDNELVIRQTNVREIFSVGYDIACGLVIEEQFARERRGRRLFIARGVEHFAGKNASKHGEVEILLPKFPVVTICNDGT